MNTLYENLYDCMAEPILNKLGNRAMGQMDELILTLPLNEGQRLNLLDGLNALRLEWSTNAFAVGLQMGVGLLAGF